MNTIILRNKVRTYLNGLMTELKDYIKLGVGGGGGGEVLKENH